MFAAAKCILHRYIYRTFDWYCIYNDATRKQVGCILTAVKGERFSCGEKRGDAWQSREDRAE